MQNVKEEILTLYPDISDQEATDYTLNLINFFKLGIEIMTQTEDTNEEHYTEDESQ